MIDLHISVALLLCIFLLCCTGSVRAASAYFSVPVGQIAAWSLLIAALSAFDIRIAENASCNAASLLFAAIALWLCRGQRETYVAVLLAFLCGILAWFLHRQLPVFFEPGLLLATPGVLLALLLPFDARLKLLCQTLSPIFFGLTTTLEEWYIFDVAVFALGSAQQLDAQVFGVFLIGVLFSVPMRRAKKTLNAQKEY